MQFARRVILPVNAGRVTALAHAAWALVWDALLLDAAGALRPCRYGATVARRALALPGGAARARFGMVGPALNTVPVRVDVPVSVDG